MELDPQSSAEALSAFERRYPIAGDTIHALLETYGGITPFIEQLERRGFGQELNGWITARHPSEMKVRWVRQWIDPSRIETVSAATGTNADSVVIQIAQYLPRLFRTLGENLDGMDFLWSHHSSHSTRSPPTQRDATQ